MRGNAQNKNADGQDDQADGFGLGDHNHADRGYQLDHPLAQGVELDKLDVRVAGKVFGKGEADKGRGKDVDDQNEHGKGDIQRVPGRPTLELGVGRQVRVDAGTWVGADEHLEEVDDHHEKERVGQKLGHVLHPKDGRECPCQVGGKRVDSQVRREEPPQECHRHGQPVGQQVLLFSKVKQHGRKGRVDGRLGVDLEGRDERERRELRKLEKDKHQGTHVPPVEPDAERRVVDRSKRLVHIRPCQDKHAQHPHQESQEEGTGAPCSHRLPLAPGHSIHGPKGKDPGKDEERKGDDVSAHLRPQRVHHGRRHGPRKVDPKPKPGFPAPSLPFPPSSPPPLGHHPHLFIL